MAGFAESLQPLPQAPTAAVPTALTADGASRVVWHPNIFAWMFVWRLIISLEVGVVATQSPALVFSLDNREAITVFVLLVWVALTGVIAALRGSNTATPLLIADLAASVTVVVLAAPTSLFGLVTLCSFSAIVPWAAGRPINAFVAAALSGSAYSIAVALYPQAGGAVPIISNLSLYCFFALACSGFFTVARRIGALEITAEIARERGRYRRDLHDRLGQALCGLHFELQAVHATGISEGVEGRLRSLADGYRDARAMLADLFSGDEPLVATNVASLIQQEARRLTQQSGARIDVTVSGDAARIPPNVRVHIWSVVGEAITNALKNGQAQGIDVDLSIADDIVVASVTDDGIGFDCPPGQIPDKPGHYGLREMQERARLSGGDVVVASAAGFGTRVRLQVPIPEDSTADIIERDAGALRINVWSLFSVLRLGLGLVSIILLVATMFSDAHSIFGWLIIAAVTCDVLVPSLQMQPLFRLLAGAPNRLVFHIAGYGILAMVAVLAEIPPYFLLYAPLVLFAAGIHGGRQLSTLLSILLPLSLIAGEALGVLLEGKMPTVEGAILYLTYVVLIGLCATQGAKLLDRLEALQIRVRYQALARLRQGLSIRMRSQLAERLDELELAARNLATHPEEIEDFHAATEVLQTGSSDLKAQLREIVHQLADPPQGRTPTHVR